MKPKKPLKDFQSSYVFARVWGVVGGIVFFCIVGYFLDQRFHKDNLFILIGFGLGILSMVWEIYKMLKSQK